MEQSGQEGTLESIQPPYHEQGHFPLDQTAQSPIIKGKSYREHCAKAHAGTSKIDLSIHITCILTAFSCTSHSHKDSVLRQKSWLSTQHVYILRWIICMETFQDHSSALLWQQQRSDSTNMTPHQIKKIGFLI